MKREDIIREVMTLLLPTNGTGYQVAKSIVKLADEPEGTWKKIGKRQSKRPMVQAEAARLVAEAKRRIELADAPD